MKKQLILTRIQRIERLAAIARQDKLVNKCQQAYWLLKACYNQLNELHNLKHV